MYNNAFIVQISPTSPGLLTHIGGIGEVHNCKGLVNLNKHS